MLILLTGNNTYTLSQKLKEIRKKFIRDVDPSNLNSARIAAESLEPGVIRRELTASPFLAKRRLVILDQCLEKISKNTGLSQEWENLGQLLSSEKKEDPIIVLVEPAELENEKRRKPPRSKSQILNTKYQILVPPYAIRIEAWVRSASEATAFAIHLFKERALIVDRSAAEFLAELSPDPWMIATLVETVASYCQGKTTVVDSATLSLFAQSATDDVLFALQDALASRNRKLCVAELTEKLYSGVHPLVILAALQRTTLLLLKAQDQQLPPATHPFVAKKMNSFALGWEPSKLKTIAGRLALCDGLMKTSSGIPAETLLTRAVVSIAP